MFRHSVMVTIVLAAALLFTAATSTRAASNAFEGRRLYTAYCLVCHGPLGDGHGPLADAMKKTPANFLSKDVKGKSDRELRETVSTGKSHDEILGMPTWNRVMAGTQIEDVVAYIRFLERSKYPLIGNPLHGKEVYRTYCALCHGDDGKGDGVMTALLPIHPADHTNTKAMDAMSNEDLARTIADGELVKYMPAWKTILTPAEIESLVGYIRLISH